MPLFSSQANIRMSFDDCRRHVLKYFVAVYRHFYDTFTSTFGGGSFLCSVNSCSGIILCMKLSCFNSCSTVCVHFLKQTTVQLKVKVKFTLEQATKSGGGNRLITFLISMFHRAFFNSIIDKHQRMHFFTFRTVLV